MLNVCVFIQGEAVYKLQSVFGDQAGLPASKQ